MREGRSTRGLFITEVMGTSAPVTLSETVLAECPVFSDRSPDRLGTVWTRLSGSLRLSAERMRGLLSTNASVTRDEEVHRDPTPEELPFYSTQIDACIQEVEYSVSEGFLLVGVSLMPLQRARVTVSLSGEGDVQFAALGFDTDLVDVEPGQEVVREITYDELERIYAEHFPFDELPPGITLPDGLEVGPCLASLFLVSYETSARISSFGSFPVNTRLSYRVEILDE
jgi:hypothetical protein